MFDFECSACKHVFEELVRSKEREQICPECGQLAKRTISPVRIDYTGIATSGDGMETSIDRFDHMHRQRRVIEERTYREHGDYGKSPGSD